MCALMFTMVGIHVFGVTAKRSQPIEAITANSPTQSDRSARPFHPQMAPITAPRRLTAHTAGVTPTPRNVLVLDLDM